MNIKSLRLTVAFGLAAAFAPAWAVELSTGPIPGAPSAPQSPAGTACGTLFLTQTTSQVPVAGTISCNAGAASNFATAENSYYRVYPSSAFPNGLNVCAVELAIESAVAGGGGTQQPLEVRIYRHSGAAFPGGTSTQIGTATVQVANSNLVPLSVPVTGAVPAGENLVVEAFIANANPTPGHRLFLGSNAGGQTAATFIRAPSCSLPTPATLASIGFPNVHLILNARGNVPAGSLSISPATPTFPAQAINTTSAPLTVTVTNTGTGPVTITSIATPAAPFAQTASTCTGATLNAAGTCTVTYTFSPTAAGAANATLAITSNAVGGATSITLNGTGVAPPQAVPGPGPLALVLGALALLGAGGVAMRRRRAA